MSTNSEVDDILSSSTIHYDVPQPDEDWKWPSAVELEVFIKENEEHNPQLLEAEGMCENSSLGLYMFMRYCREQGNRTKVFAEFIEDVATFRGSRLNRLSVNLAKKIELDYIREGSTGRKNKLMRRACNMTRKIKHQEEGDDSSEYIYPPSTCRTAASGSEYDCSSGGLDSSGKLTSTERNYHPVWAGYLSITTAKNAIKVAGDPIADVISQLVNFVPDVSSSKVKKINLNVFDKLDEIVFSYLKDMHYKGFQNSFWWTRLQEYMCLSERNVLSEDFTTFRVLGRGGFGMVNACRRRTTGKPYAMKRLHKKCIKMKRVEAHCLRERTILATVNSPFVVCLRYAFTTPTDLYLILDLMTGGDLGFYLSRKGRFPEIETKYYAARILLGIADMHKQSIAHRDLKPQNILMDEDGYTKISDLGLACKVGKSGLSGTCGTRGYWAPEMLRRDADNNREKYTLSVDWFSFGCCLYEFMYGISPFRTEKARQWGTFPVVEKADRDRAIDLAIQQMEPDFDECIFNSTITDLISKLLVKDGKQRLGANGFKEIAAHPWFNDVDWHDIERSKPPFQPSTKDMYFLQESKLGLFPNDKASKRVSLSDSDHQLYESWEFISKSSYEEEIIELLVCEELSGPIKVTDRSDECCTLC